MIEFEEVHKARVTDLKALLRAIALDEFPRLQRNGKADQQDRGERAERHT